MKKLALLFFILSTPFFLASCGKDNGQSTEATHSSSSVKVQVSSTTKSSSSSEDTQATSNSMASSSSSQAKEEDKVDTKNLSADQVKEWVASIWVKRKNIDPFKNPDFDILLETKEDGLLYATVESTTQQIDTLDSFRISSDGFLEESGYFQSMPDKGWIVVSKEYLDTSMVNKEKQATSATEGNTPSSHEAAEMLRDIMEKNQGLDADVLASIPDDVLLEASAGNATNSQIAQTAENLIRLYPDLKP
ncbi:hypothetical protein [Candidatus Enterococcus murrayae]|uniref:Lipoprotein n=1 Tax=Candidatus Enterococcus murrayae TaxID=2815321 RepID=A0ABS3HEB5_9ENTE|nr:hypothetical protein [Enterococcus sp. MJM16]MBO0451337.1 hypothetical protein [Enterococcus sp. MJM16]